jgi:nitrous oxide reductase
VWHADDLKLSHVDSKVVTSVIEIIEKEFAKHKPLTIQRGLLHDYLGKTIDVSVKGKVMITMIDFIEKMLEEIPEDMKGEKQSPAQDHLFKVNEEDGIRLEEKERAIVHRNTAKFVVSVTTGETGCANIHIISMYQSERSRYR